MGLARTADNTGISRRTFVSGALLGGAGSLVASTAAQAGRPTSADADVSATGDGFPVGDPTDVAFCIDMSTHHVQAIGMCERVLGRDTGGAVQSAATEVIRNQSIEVGMMRAWLTDWGASTATPTTVMGWMAMAGNTANGMDTDEMHDAGIPLAAMPGYATDAEMQGLSQSEPGIPQGRMWLELMSAHHAGGVMMAAAAVDLAVDAKVIRLARTQAAVQAFEIAQYELLLSSTYA